MMKPRPRPSSHSSDAFFFGAATAVCATGLLGQFFLLWLLVL